MARRGGTTSEKKTCFVICPIGKENSAERQWSNDVLECIITPVVEDMGYDTPIRADRINESGIITSQIVELLVESHLVIADLSFRNPNVFYELAVRHVTKKPCIHMIRAVDENPFDTSSNRAIVFDLSMRSGNKAKEDLKKQIESIHNGSLETDNPISTALTLKDLKSSGNTQQYTMAQVLEEMRDLRNEIKFQRPKNPNKMIWFNEIDPSGNPHLVDRYEKTISEIELVLIEIHTLKSQNVSPNDERIRILEKRLSFLSNERDMFENELTNSQ